MLDFDSNWDCIWAIVIPLIPLAIVALVVMTRNPVTNSLTCEKYPMQTQSVIYPPAVAGIASQPVDGYQYPTAQQDNDPRPPDGNKTYREKWGSPGYFPEAPDFSEEKVSEYWVSRVVSDALRRDEEHQERRQRRARIESEIDRRKNGGSTPKLDAPGRDMYDEIMRGLEDWDGRE